jgi:hypothetical protein
MSGIRRSITASVALALVATTMSLSAVAASPAPLMPDLGMARLRAFKIDTSVPGRTLLRFTTVIINIGDGPFEAYGDDEQPNGDLLVDEQIHNDDGSVTTYPTDYHMYFAGDGHHHWHLRDLETYVLQNDNASIKVTGAKHGFCFFDNYRFNLSLPGAPQSPVYTGCGDQSDTQVTMGLSIGWGDKYGFKLPDQYIDITNLPSGQYTVTATADAQNGFAELCETNNTTAAVLQITGNSVTVLDKGKPSKRC